MASCQDTMYEHANPGQIAQRLNVSLQRRKDLSVSPTSPPTSGSLLETKLASCVASCTRSSTPASGNNTPRPVLPGLMTSPANSSDSTVKIASHKSLPAPRAARNGSGMPVGGVKKRRSRASKKPPTKIVESDSANFRDLVQKLTGGTYCKQSESTASPLVSCTSVEDRRRDPVEVSDVVRPQPSRPNANGTTGDAVTIKADAPTAPTPLQDPNLLAFFECMGSEDNSLNAMMGYANPWMILEANFPEPTTESVGVSTSIISQYPGVLSTEITKAPVYSSSFRDSSLATPTSKSGGDPLSNEDTDRCGEDVMSWLCPEKSVYISL